MPTFPNSSLINWGQGKVDFLYHHPVILNFNFGLITFIKQLMDRRHQHLMKLHHLPSFTPILVISNSHSTNLSTWQFHLEDFVNFGKVKIVVVVNFIYWKGGWGLVKIDN